MPNWCEGTLKVRGSTENIVKWLKEGLNKYEYNYETGEQKLLDKNAWQYIHEEDGFVTIDLDLNSRGHDAYVENTERAFVSSDQTWNLKADGEIEVLYLQFKQAWCIKPEEFAALAKQYQLDFNLYGIEMGMGFICEYEIFNHGEAIVDNTKTFKSYDDFLWYCPFPYMGG